MINFINTIPVRKINRTKITAFKIVLKLQQY